MTARNVLVWHVHGSWLDAFVRGPHRYLLPVRDGAPHGRKRPHWPANVVEVTPAAARAERIDAVVLQRTGEADELPDYLGARRPGRDVPVIFLEHNAPQGRINEMRHPYADRDDLTIVHVTHFNALFWDCGRTRTRLIEHGIPDPGVRYTGELERCAVVINEANRRARVTGTDLLPALERVAPVDLYGIGAIDLPMPELHAAIARRRVYAHPFRWTSLGLALLEAMACGMPVVALATTEVPRAVPPGTGVVTNSIAEFTAAVAAFVADPALAAATGARARAHVLRAYGLDRFLLAWDAVLDEAIADTSSPEM